MENIISEIRKLEKEKSLQLEKLEQMQFRKGIATTRRAEISEQIKTVNNFKTEKSSNLTLAMRRVDTRQAQLDDLMNKISQCRASIEKTQVSSFSFGSLVSFSCIHCCIFCQMRGEEGGGNFFRKF